MKKNSLIALITDFGANDYFAGVVKGVIKSANPAAEIIDVCHEVKPFSLINAQYMVASSFKYFPPGTIFCIVVDPGVGTARRGIIAMDESYVFIAPDNGIISPAASAKMDYYRIADKFFRNVSATFHGRDVFAPVAAALAKKLNPEKFGKKINDPVLYKFPDYKILDNRIESVSMHVDRFGNIITSIPHEILRPCETGFIITTGGRSFPAKMHEAYDAIKDGFGLIEGSSGFIEIAERQKSAAENLDVDTGDRILVSYG